MAVKADLQLTLRVDETYTKDLGVLALPHLLDASAVWVNGSGSNQAQVVYSDSNSVASGSPVTYDLRGTLLGADGSAANFNPVRLLAIRNRSTTTGQNLQVGGGSNSWNTWVGATGDIVIVPPGGVLVLSSPIDGFGTTVGTADILQIASASGTIPFDILLIGG